MDFNKKRSSAFTLIEILVVIVVLGVLIGILAPAIRGGVDSAKTAACANNLRQFYIGLEMYAQEHDGNLWTYPPSQQGSISYSTLIWFWDSKAGIGFLHSQYLDDLNIFYCPAKKNSRRNEKTLFGQFGKFCNSDYIAVTYSDIRLENLKNEVIVEDNEEGFWPQIILPHRGKRNKLYGDGSIRLGVTGQSE